jgi:hypothetical protein
VFASIPQPLFHSASLIPGSTAVPTPVGVNRRNKILFWYMLGELQRNVDWNIIFEYLRPDYEQKDGHMIAGNAVAIRILLADAVKRVGTLLDIQGVRAFPMESATLKLLPLIKEV